MYELALVPDVPTAPGIALADIAARRTHPSTVIERALVPWSSGACGIGRLSAGAVRGSAGPGVCAATAATHIPTAARLVNRLRFIRPPSRTWSVGRIPPPVAKRQPTRLYGWARN